MTTTIKRTRGYRVKAGCSVMLPARNGIAELLTAGAVVPDGALTKKQIEEHVNSGFLEPTVTRQSFENDTLVENAPGMVPPTPIKTEDEVESYDDRAIRVSGRPIKTEMRPAKSLKVSANAPVSKSSPWILNPAGLEGKSLEELNVMVLERSKTIAAFETKEEAIAQLSQDFEG